LCISDRLEMLWRGPMLSLRDRADKGTRDCIASIHASVHRVTRGGGVVPELEGELRSLKELSGLAQITSEPQKAAALVSSGPGALSPSSPCPLRR